MPKTNDKLTKIRSSICRLDYQELGTLESWLRKRIQKMWPVERVKRKRAHEESIKALPKGTIVVFTDSRHKFCGKVGKIVRHLGRNSNRTAVDFQEIGIWHIPRVQLSANVSEDRIKGLKVCKNLSGVLNKVFSKMQGETNG